jgi:hypothetical protein
VAAVRPWLWDGRRNVDEPTLIVAEGSRDDTEEEGSIVA